MVIHNIIAKILLFEFALFVNKALILFHFFVNHSKRSSFLLLILIYGGENLLCIRSFTIKFRLVPEVNFLSKKIKNSGQFLLKYRNNFVLGGELKTLCISSGRDKEQGPKLFLLKPLLLKVNNSNNCTITDNY